MKIKKEKRKRKKKKKICSLHREKSSILSGLARGSDKSPKGFIDKPIRDLVMRINASADYVTTSSCSGRISLYDNATRTWKISAHREVERGEICQQYKMQKVRRSCSSNMNPSSCMFCAEI